MTRTLTVITALALLGLLLGACGTQRPEIGTPGRVSLVFFYTEG